MLKKLIAPLQKILIQKGVCPACTASLSKAPRREPRSQKEEIVYCKCGRAFIYDRELDSYRRALDSEISLYPR